MNTVLETDIPAILVRGLGRNVAKFLEGAGVEHYKVEV